MPLVLRGVCAEFGYLLGTDGDGHSQRTQQVLNGRVRLGIRGDAHVGDEAKYQGALFECT